MSLIFPACYYFPGEYVVTWAKMDQGFPAEIILMKIMCYLIWRAEAEGLCFKAVVNRRQTLLIFLEKDTLKESRCFTIRTWKQKPEGVRNSLFARRHVQELCPTSLSLKRMTPHRGGGIYLSEPLLAKMQYNQWRSGSPRGWSGPPGDIWQCVQTFLMAVTECSWHVGSDEARDAVTHPKKHRTTFCNKDFLAQMLTVLSLRKPGLEDSTDSKKVPGSQPELGLGGTLSWIPEREYVAFKYFYAYDWILSGFYRM